MVQRLKNDGTFENVYPPVIATPLKAAYVDLQVGQVVKVTLDSASVGSGLELDTALGTTLRTVNTPVGTTTFGPFEAFTRFVFACMAGEVKTVVHAAGLTSLQPVISSSGVAGLATPDGALGVVASRQALTLCEFGASFNELNDRFGLGFSTPVNIAGAATVYGNILAPSVTCLLEWDAKAKRMRATYTGDPAGTWTDTPTDGIYNCYSGNPANSVRVSVVSRLMPTTDKSDLMTPGARVWSRPNGSWKYQLSFAMKERIKWLPTQGIGGNQSTDIAGRMPQIAALPADAFLMCLSGNDYVTGNLSVSASVAQAMANADVILKTGRQVIMQTLPARYGKSASGADLTFTGEWTAQRQANLVNGNRAAVVAALARRMNIADWSASTDPLSTTSAAMNGHTVDGKHPAGGLAHTAADANVPILNAMLVGSQVPTNVGGGDYYSAINPGGNLLKPNQGAFAADGPPGSFNAGTSATASWATATVMPARAYRISAGNLYYSPTGGTTGATAPTHMDGTVSDGGTSWTFLRSGIVSGLATGWIMTTEGAGVNVTVHFYTDRDGNRWQEFVVFGGTADGGGFRASPETIPMANVSAGDVVTFDYDVEIENPRECYGLYADMQVAGVTIVWDNQSMSSIQQGLKWTSGKMSLEPMPIPTGVTGLQPRTHAQTKANGVFVVRYKTASARKIL